MVPNQGWYDFGTVEGELVVVIMMGGMHYWHLSEQGLGILTYDNA